MAIADDVRINQNWSKEDGYKCEVVKEEAATFTDKMGTVFIPVTERLEEGTVYEYIKGTLSPAPTVTAPPPDEVPSIVGDTIANDPMHVDGLEEANRIVKERYAQKRRVVPSEERPRIKGVLSGFMREGPTTWKQWTGEDDG
jgi:hypothetical protein